MKKFLTAKRAALALTLALLLACFLPLAVSAAEGESEESTPVTTAPMTTAPVTTAPAESAVGDDTPIATLLHEFLKENLSGLLSGATFLLALVLSLLLRKRVLPPLLETLTTLLGKSRDLSEALCTREAEGHERLAGLSPAKSPPVCSRKSA